MIHEKLSRRTTLAGAALLLLAVDCQAQGPPEDHSCTVDFAVEYTQPYGKDGNNFNSGGGFQTGGGFEVWHPAEAGHRASLYLTANFLYTRLAATAGALAAAKSSDIMEVATATSARGSFYATTFDPTFRYALNRRTNLYLVGGFGWFRRGVEFKADGSATLTESGAGTFGKADANSGVFDFGGGANFGLTRKGGPMLYAEARVYRGLAINNATTLLPLSVGVRW